MKATTPPIFTASVPGPWGVDSIGRDWYVIHIITLRAKRIGRIGNKRPGGRWGINYFDRAIEEATLRNIKERNA